MVHPTGSTPTMIDAVQSNQPETIVVSGKIYIAASEALPVKEDRVIDKISRVVTTLANSQIVQTGFAILALRLMYVAEKALLNKVNETFKDDPEYPESVTSRSFLEGTVKETFDDLRQSVVLNQSTVLRRSQLYVK